MLRVWARILKAVPNSRLLLKNKPFACISAKQHFLDQVHPSSPPLPGGSLCTLLREMCVLSFDFLFLLLFFFCLSCFLVLCLCFFVFSFAEALPGCLGPRMSAQLAALLHRILSSVILCSKHESPCGAM